MKSKELGIFQKNISELNNSFTHYSFVWKQFSIDYNDAMSKKPDDLTSKKFSNNPFAEKHNVELGKLEIEHDKTNKTLIEGIYLLAFSYYESYFKEIITFARQINPDIPDLEEELESNLADYFLIDKVVNRISNEITLDDQIYRTLDYLRLKRNRLAHRNSESISNSLLDLIKIEGKSINIFWSENLKSGLQIIDFASKDKANEIEFDTIIDLINILRFIIQKLDKQIMKELKSENIICKKLIPEFAKKIEKKKNNISQKRLINKFRSYCKSEFSIVIDDSHERDFLKAI
jgi:hypothetical protein